MLLKGMKFSSSLSFKQTVKKIAFPCVFRRDLTPEELHKKEEERQHLKIMFSEMLNKKFDSIKLETQLLS